MSDTPRTDAHYKQIYDEGLGLEYCETELRSWAEKLERELAEAWATVALRDAEILSLRDDAARYRKIMAIRGQHIGVPCACQFADDDETLLKTCNSHRDLFAAKDAEIAQLRDAARKGE